MINVCVQYTICNLSRNFVCKYQPSAITVQIKALGSESENKQTQNPEIYIPQIPNIKNFDFCYLLKLITQKYWKSTLPNPIDKVSTNFK